MATKFDSLGKTARKRIAEECEKAFSQSPTPFDDPPQLASLYDTVHSLVGRMALLESRLATVKECKATPSTPSTPTAARLLPLARLRLCNCGTHRKHNACR